MRATVALAGVVLVGCSGAAPGHPGPTTSADTGRLVGHLGLYGGPLLPNGHMADEDAPQSGALVIATAAATRQVYRATSDSAGRFAFTLPPGRYTVTSRYCVPRTVAVRAGQTTTQPIVCPIP